jgi:hypothetical protein
MPFEALRQRQDMLLSSTDDNVKSHSCTLLLSLGTLVFCKPTSIDQKSWNKDWAIMEVGHGLATLYIEAETVWQAALAYHYSVQQWGV